MLYKDLKATGFKMRLIMIVHGVLNCLIVMHVTFYPVFHGVINQIKKIEEMFKTVANNVDRSC